MRVAKVTICEKRNGIKQHQAKKPREWRPNACMRSELRCQEGCHNMSRGVCWFGFFFSSCFVSSGSALIGSSSPVFRSSSSSNYILFSPPSVLYLLAFLLLFWLGSATGHRSQTPTTTPFQYTVASHNQSDSHLHLDSFIRFYFQVMYWLEDTSCNELRERKESVGRKRCI